MLQIRGTVHLHVLPAVCEGLSRCRQWVAPHHAWHQGPGTCKVLLGSSAECLTLRNWTYAHAPFILYTPHMYVCMHGKVLLSVQ